MTAILICWAAAIWTWRCIMAISASSATAASAASASAARLFSSAAS